MKKYISTCIIFILILFVDHLLAQTHPQIGNLRGINYQAVAIDENGKEIVGMDVEGKPLYEKTIGVRFSILKGSDGPIQYQETHTALTDKYGLFSLVIGEGSQTGSGQFTTLMNIPWIDADQFLKVEIATKNDGNYKMVSNQQFMAVPYSFYTNDIADDAITTWKILDSTIVNQDISTGAIDSRTILNGTILNEDVSTGAIDSRTILDSTILNIDIATGAVDTRVILNNTILNEDVSTGAIDSRTILDSTILNIDIATGAIDSRTILNGTILNEDVSTGAIDSRTILDSTILNTDIANGAVDTRVILNNTILNEDVSTGAIDSRTILDSTILNNDVATGAIDSRAILNSTVLNEDIADGTIDLSTKVTNVLPVTNGGTGTSSLTNSGLLLGGDTNPIRALPQAIDGQIPVGVTAADPKLKLLSGGAGINITFTSDSVIISSGIQGINTATGGNVVVGTISTGTTFVSPAIPLAGVDFGNIVVGSCNVDMKGCLLSCYVFSPNNIKVAIFNGTGVPQTLGTVALKVFVVQ